MIPISIKYITVSRNEDFTYNVVYIADLLDGDTLYEDCEVILPRVVKLDNNIIVFPYYNEEEEILITITIPRNE